MAATTISRSTWTDDDGSGTTGTIINNARLQADVYDKVDALLSGAATLEAGGNVIVDGNLTVVGSLINASAPLTLLRANSGTSTAAGATTVDSIALASGLTAKDTIIVAYLIESITQDTALTRLYNVTDAVDIVYLCTGAGVVTNGATFDGQAQIFQRPGAATTIAAQARGFNTLAVTAADDGRRSTFATNWTGAWTLGLRHGGVTAGGTFSWSWRVYKLAGQ